MQISKDFKFSHGDNLLEIKVYFSQWDLKFIAGPSNK